MGKQTKGKKVSGSGGRPTPYAKKPVVEVRYEGGPTRRAAASAGDKGKRRAASPVGDAAEAFSSAPAAASTSASSLGGSTSTPASFKIIAGSYEKLLYGLEGTYTAGSSRPALAPIFIFPAHLACVKAAAASAGGKWLATGSEDEFVKVWDLRRRKEVGSLSQHTGSITSLTFPTPSHLLTTSDDATLSLFRTSDWALLKSLKGHSGRVNHVDVHPTGRVALSVGKDRTLKMWDLMRGRGAASLPLGDEADEVRFSATGRWFAVLFRSRVEVYSLTLNLLYTLGTKSKYNAVLFAQMPAEDGEGRELLCVGTEKGLVEVYDFSYEESEEDEQDNEDDADDAEGSAPKATVDRVATLVGHTNRIKAMSSLRFTPPGSVPTVLFTTVSSDGLINLHDLALVPTSGGANTNVEPIAAYDTKGSRLTCVFLADGGVKGPAGVKAKKEVEVREGRAMFEVDAAAGEEDEDEDEEDEDEGADMYESGSGDEEGDEDGMEVEIEGEEEEEDEEEGEYE
ncbi:transcription initiation at TATA-containing promoter protein [Cryptotrichosporon argae]